MFASNKEFKEYIRTSEFKSLGFVLVFGFLKDIFEVKTSMYLLQK